MQGISQGTTLAGRYTLTRRVAQHDIAEQWVATDSTLDREVSIACFPADGEHAEATLDSARRAAGVEDHHLLRVLDVGTGEAVSFVVTELLHGAESVADILSFDTIPAEEARRLIGETSTGLNTAAARGLHHLQLRPHDIMRSRDGSVSVLGIAIAAALSGLDEVPSQDASRADAVALVRVLYTALTGRWPGDEDLPGLVRATRRADGVLPAPSELVTGVPGDLDALCRTTLNADEGPRTPGELARQLSPWSSERVHGAGGRPALHEHSSERGRSPASRPPLTAVDTPGADAGDTGTGAEDPFGRWPQFDDESRPTALDADDTITFDATAAHKSGMTGRPGREVTDLEPPIPLLQAGTTDPDGGMSRMAIGIVGVFVVLALVLGAIGLSSAFKQSGKTATTPSATPTASATPSPKSSRPSPSATPKPTPVTIQHITSFDPDGNGDEHNELAPLAIDGNPDTEWVTHIYGSDTFGGVKSGTGLILDLGSSKTVGSVKIDLDGTDTTIDVFVTSSPSIKDQTPFGTVKDGGGKQTVTAAKSVKGQYVILWITKLSRNSGGYRDKIREVQVLS